MNLKTSNYGAARSVLGFAEISWWVGFGLGVVLAFTGGGAASVGISGGAGILGALPGILIAIFCFNGVVNVQQTKAAVDSADYAYQGLAIARQQLEISKQSLKQETRAQSFADRPDVAPRDKPAPADAGATQSHRKVPSAYAPPPSVPDALKTSPRQEEYRGLIIQRSAEGFAVQGQVFETLELAKNFVDGEALRAGLASPT